jgi:transposase
MRRHEITDAHWAVIRDFFTGRKRTGRPPKEDRTILNGILWILHTGAAWRDLPEERFGKWKTVYGRFNRWRRNGLFDRILKALHLKLDRHGLIDNTLWCIDGSVTRATRAAAGARTLPDGEPTDHALGRSQGGFSTKLHLVTDGRGLPLSVELTGGQVHESKAFVPTIDAALERVAVGTRAKTTSPRRRRQGL